MKQQASGKGQQLQLQQRSEAPTSEGDPPVLGKELASAVDFFVLRSEKLCYSVYNGFFYCTIWVFGGDLDS